MLISLLVLFGLLIVLIATNMPIAIALGISSLAVFLIYDLASINTFITTSFSASDSFPLIAIPMFILAGEIMGSGGIAQKLISFSEKLFGSFKGGLGLIAIMASLIFAAISGSGPATVAAIGGIMLPYMINKGYSKSYSASLLASAGSLGPIVPPSILFILYGVMTNASIGDMFIAGIIPGILIAFALVFVNFFVARKMDHNTTTKTNFKDVIKGLNEAKWALIAPIIVLGGIYGGIFTPTEAAVVAVVYSIVVSLFIHKEITFKDLPNIFMRASATSGGVMILIGVASFFGKVLSFQQVPQYITNLVTGFTDNALVMLLIFNLLLLMVGMLLETVSALMIFGPLLYPVAISLGVDPIHFGIIICLNLTLGLLTPPLGVNVFIASRIANIRFEKTFKYLFPMFGALLLVLLLVTIFPQISLLLI